MPDKDEVARILAQKHREIETGITQILRFQDRVEVEVLPAEPIKLLEVNTDTVPSGVMPIQFGAAPGFGIPYSTVILEVTPDEFEKIRAKELKLPSGWLDFYEIPSETEPVKK
jgi:hypothetical protein